MALSLLKNGIQNLYNVIVNRRKSIFEDSLKFISTIVPIKLENVQNNSYFHTKTSLKNTYDHLVNQKGNDSKGPTKECPGRHQFHKETETALNEQICMEFHAAFAYLSMACYFGRTDIALPGCQGFYMDMHKEEHEHGTILLNYVLMRGGTVHLSDIVISQVDWKGIVHTFETSLEMEKNVKESLCKVHSVAEKHRDLHLADFISTDFMEEQNHSICKMARFLVRAKMVDNAVGEHLFDKWIFDSFVTKSEGNLMYKRKLDLGQPENVYI